MNKKRFYILASMLSLAAILTISAIILVIVSGRRAQSNIRNADNVVTQMQDKKNAADTVINSFYNWYIRGNSDVFGSQAYKDRGNLTSGLIGKIEKSVNSQKDSENKIDPIICGKGMPDTVVVTNIQLEDDKASAEINLTYINSRKVKLNLVMQGGQWRISDIVCP